MKKKKKNKKKTWPLGSRAIKFIQKSYSSELGWNFNGKYAKPVCSGEGYMNIMVLLCCFFFFSDNLRSYEPLIKNSIFSH